MVAGGVDILKASENSPQYPFNGSLNGLHGHFERCGEDRNSALPRIHPALNRTWVSVSFTPYLKSLYLIIVAPKCVQCIICQFNARHVTLLVIYLTSYVYECLLSLFRMYLLFNWEYLSPYVCRLVYQTISYFAYIDGRF